MNIPPYDAWVLHRLVVGHTVNGELQALSKPYRELANKLAGIEVDTALDGSERLAALATARKPAWESALAALADRDELIRAVFDADPDGPAPESEAETDAEWGPIRLGSMPPVEPFPTDVFPDAVADFTRLAARSFSGCPEDFVGLPILVVAGAAIGRSASLRLKQGYFATASLYGVEIGEPSCGKSPAQDAVTRPTWKRDEQLHEAFKVERDAYLEAIEAHANAPKGSPKPPTPPKPVLRSVVVENATVESLAPLLAVNRRGLLLARDEVSGWVGSFNQYKSGGRGDDRQFWLSVLYGKPIRIDRKSNPDEPVRVAHPFLSVIGGIQPDMLTSFQEGGSNQSDGFLERILFAYPDPRPRPRWSDVGLPDEASNTWAEIVSRLRSRPMATPEGRPQPGSEWDMVVGPSDARPEAVADEGARPHVVTFGPKAKARWVEWYNEHADEANAPGYDAGDRASDTKLCDFAARLVLILHLLNLACDPTRGDTEEIPPVPRSAVDGAIRLWAYFRSHARRVRWCLNGGVGNRDARTIVEWIKRNRVETFSERDLKKDMPRFRDTPEAMSGALRWLAERNVIIAAPDPERPQGTRGRKPSASWMVNPALLTPRD